MIEVTEATETIDEVTCTACMTVPISHLSLEEGVSVPLTGWQSTFDQMNIKTVVDAAGRLAISTLAARRLLAALRRQGELRAEQAQRQFEKVTARHPIGAGFPALENASAMESLAASAGYQLPSDEFQGIPKPRFLEDEILASEHDLAEKRRLADERAKERLAKQMQDRLR